MVRPLRSAVNCSIQEPVSILWKFALLLHSEKVDAQWFSQYKLKLCINDEIEEIS